MGVGGITTGKGKVPRKTKRSISVGKSKRSANKQGKSGFTIANAKKAGSALSKKAKTATKAGVAKQLKKLKSRAISR